MNSEPFSVYVFGDSTNSSSQNDKVNIEVLYPGMNHEWKLKVLQSTVY